MGEIGESLDLSLSAVKSAMKNGIERRSSAESQTDGDLNPLKDEAWLCEQGKATRKIAGELNSPYKLEPPASRSEHSERVGRRGKRHNATQPLYDSQLTPKCE